MCTELAGRCGSRRVVRATLTTVITLVLAACNGTTSYMDATGTAGRREATLGWWLTAVSCVVVLFVIVAVLAGIAPSRW